MNQWQNFTKGILKENPVLVLVLGTCPTLATTTSAINGLGMGLAFTFVLALSNVIISAVRKMVPNIIRIPIFIVIIATFVTIVDMVMHAYVPDLYKALGIFIPLIVVNCIVLGRAEAFASKNNILSSLVDGLGMGVGFTLLLTVLGSIREILGAGSIFGYKFIAPTADGILVFILAPGAFLTLAILMALNNLYKNKTSKTTKNS
ncbi:MAG TPA: electron transport complex subunit E [Bacteroidales bacterium]|jgi:electron transport complex protein RnfE|nr:electron transport complex subunit E [Bacteroidales bacterium]OQC41079.1 MAG: Electron transport complex protein RnfE [Bacteroidetes bacterium ADurb.Bin035]MBP8946022.1 electron transport complex subunit E [Bacteroidales bacterium]HNQ20532.1 electron transport complex subunit E [Bacteroidales bacterium]HNT70715.1 electron transport complex subunit E [Bacteroidales bacterium]